MGLYDDCIRDAARYTSDAISGFGVPVTFTDSNGVSVTVNALHAKHHTAVDDNGALVSSKTANVSVSESVLKEASPSFLIRDPSTKNVVMKGYKVVVKDSSGQTCYYKIMQQFPDETIGLLVFTLMDYKNA
jgi:hypothetical protein